MHGKQSQTGLRKEMSPEWVDVTIYFLCLKKIGNMNQIRLEKILNTLSGV